MYLDSVVIAGLIIVVLVCVMAAYIGVFAYKHIKLDIAASEASEKSEKQGKAQPSKA
jgi:hypothetical protein